MARHTPSPPEVVIHEEGLVHRLFTLFGYNGTARGDSSDLIHVAQLTPEPDLVFWTRCSPALAVERLNARVDKIPERLAGLAVSEIEQVLAEADKKIELGLEVFRNRGTEIVEMRTDTASNYHDIFQKFFGHLN